jgi:hypothetical protein
MTISSDSRHCFDVLGDVDAAVREVLTPDQPYYVLGGIATAAIKDPDSVFDHQTSRLIASREANEPVIRENGTRRDIDVLVLDVLSEDQATKVKLAISVAVGKSLVVSTFGLNWHEESSKLASVGNLFSDWTSKRTLDEHGKLRYELQPLEQEVPRESFSPWALELPNGDEVAILNPAAHMLAYYMRSISGLRVKDQAKVEIMRQRILTDPLFVEQVHDGPLKSWVSFADDIAKLGNKGDARELGYDLGRVTTFVAHQKSKMLRFFESNETIVKHAQKGILQAMLKPFVGSS